MSASRSRPQQPLARYNTYRCFQSPIGLLGVDHSLSPPSDSELTRHLFQQRRPWEFVDVQLWFGAHVSGIARRLLCFLTAEAVLFESLLFL